MNDCRAGAVLNPHYRLMGLHGSEYWTYTLPRRVVPTRRPV
jgi:putative two-component system hydrogenase maturation factor HypX/HoxX